MAEPDSPETPRSPKARSFDPVVGVPPSDAHVDLLRIGRDCEGTLGDFLGRGRIRILEGLQGNVDIAWEGISVPVREVRNDSVNEHEFLARVQVEEGGLDEGVHGQAVRIVIEFVIVEFCSPLVGGGNGKVIEALVDPGRPDHSTYGPRPLKVIVDDVGVDIRGVLAGVEPDDLIVGRVRASVDLVELIAVQTPEDVAENLAFEDLGCSAIVDHEAFVGHPVHPTPGLDHGIGSEGPAICSDLGEAEGERGPDCLHPIEVVVGPYEDLTSGPAGRDDLVGPREELVPGSIRGRGVPVRQIFRCTPANVEGIVGRGEGIWAPERDEVPIFGRDQDPRILGGGRGDEGCPDICARGLVPVVDGPAPIGGN